MALVTYNIPDEIKKDIDSYPGNKSALISKLLNEYFSLHYNRSKDRKERLEQESDILNKKLENIKIEKEEIEIAESKEILQRKLLEKARQERQDVVKGFGKFYSKEKRKENK